jgi:hypothetical protein
VSLRILLLSSDMNCLDFVYNLIHGIGYKLLCVKDLCHLPINVTYAKKLQRLDQRDMSVQDYYAELQKGMICVGVHEEMEDKICHFYSGLRTKFRLLLTIRNTILLIVCSSLLCWPKKNCRVNK